MPEETLIAGGVTVIDDGDIVSAGRAEPEPPPPTPEPDAPSTPTPESEPETPAPPTEAAESTERDEQGRFKPAAKEGAKPPVERRKESIQAQIDRTRYELGEEQRRLDRIRQERIQAEQQTTKPAAPTVTGQTFKEFVVDYAAKNPEATYEDAIDAYRVVERTEMLRQLREEQQQEHEGRELQTQLSAHQERVIALRATLPDWDAVNASADAYMAARGFAVLPEVLRLAIIRSDKSAHIVRDLSEHPEIAIQRAIEAKDLPSTAAAVTLMRTVLESRLSSSGKTAPPSGPVSPPIQSRSNPPPKPVGNSPVASAASEEEPSLDEMRERVRKTLHTRR